MNTKSTCQYEKLAQEFSDKDIYYSVNRIQGIFGTEYTPKQLEHLAKTLPVALECLQYIQKRIDESTFIIEPLVLISFSVRGCMLVPSPHRDIYLLDRSVFVSRQSFQGNITEHATFKNTEEEDKYINKHLLPGGAWMIVCKELLESLCLHAKSWERCLQDMNINKEGCLSMPLTHTESNSNISDFRKWLR